MKPIVMDVTPEQAQEWLRNNEHNRNLRQDSVAYYAKEMLDGRWEVTGCGITLSEDGELIDGQHRLSAIVKANIPVKMLVSFDAKKSVHYDDGMKRTQRDQFKMSGKNVEHYEIAIAQYALTLLTGVRKHSIEELESYMARHEHAFYKFHNACNRATRVNGCRNLIRKAAIGLAVVSAIENGCNEDEVVYWCDRVATGLYEHPYEQVALSFRNKLLFADPKTAGSAAYRDWMLNAAENNIMHYVNKDGVMKIMTTKELVYPIPE